MLKLFYFDLSLIGFLALMLSLYQFILLFESIGHFIPVRYLFGSFMCLQFFVGPTLAYNGLSGYEYFMYRMRVSEMEYFSYAIPAVLSFIVGLHLFAGNLNGEVVNEKRIKEFVQKNPKLPYVFIIVGLFVSMISGYFSSELVFVFYLIGSFKFIGLFMLVLGSDQLKPLPMVVVIGSIVSSSLASGMFHDLLTWIIFTGAVFAIKYKITFKVKIIGAVAFIFMVTTIQLLKGSFRGAIAEQGGGVDTFLNVYENAGENEGNGLFRFDNLASANTRINQGFIITNIMVTVPEREPFSNGKEMMQILEAAVMPRILAPDKLKAGDREIVTKYSGIRLAPGTSMGLSSVGDAYINFGAIGGCVFMFVLGLFYSAVLNVFKKQSADYPVLILFTALVFYYPIRPDCELQTILGHLVKSCFLIFVMMQIWKFKFKMTNVKLVGR